jgi:hypothetical protein
MKAMMRRPLPVLGLLLLAPIACADDPASPASDDGAGTDDGGDDGDDDGDDDDDDDGATGPGDDDDDGDTGGADTGEPLEDEPARAITIAKVEANSGVAVPIAENGEWVGGAGRNAPLPKGRDTAIRIYLDVDDDVWVSREIMARMTVTQSDGTESVYEETAEVAGDSSLTSLQSNILLGVLAADINPGALFQVELFEAGTGWEDLPPASSPPVAIADGPDQIGIEGSTQNMRLVIVPIDYSFGGCSTLPDLDQTALQPYEDSMYQQNALETIEIEVHSPMVVNDLDLTDSGDFFGLLNRIVQLRASDSPDPNVYYYGLFDNCGACIGDGGGCLLGVAPGTPGDSQGEASQRAAIGVRYLSGSEVGIETFVHEIGHTQGRQHVACEGASSAGPDPSYPYDGGVIGVWGFGVRDFSIYSATSHTDYMSYCNPTWVSDWQWSATFDRIKALSQWQTQDVVPPPTTEILVGTVDTQTGESHWWTEPGLVEAGDPKGNADLVLRGSASELHRVAADVDPWSEGSWVTVRANLPSRAVVDAADVFELALPDRTLEVERSHVRFDLAGSLKAR